MAVHPSSAFDKAAVKLLGQHGVDPSDIGVQRTSRSTTAQSARFACSSAKWLLLKVELSPEDEAHLSGLGDSEWEAQ